MDHPESEAPVEGVVRIGDHWEFGTLGSHVTDNIFNVRYARPSGKMSYVKRDVKDENQWRPGVEVLPDADVATEKAAKVKAPKAPKAPRPVTKHDPHEIVHYATGDAPRGKNKFPADQKFKVCTGACGLRKPGKSFPTIAGTSMRVSECRSCRDARRAKEAESAA